MIRFPVAAVLAVALVLSAPAGVRAGEAATDRRVESVLGDPSVYKMAFATLKKSVRSGDRRQIAALVRYPINVRLDGRRQMISDEGVFIAQYERIMTPRIASAIANQRWDSVLVTSKGIMIGDGEVWLNGICRDTMCRMFDAKVTTIQESEGVQ